MAFPDSIARIACQDLQATFLSCCRAAAAAAASATGSSGGGGSSGQEPSTRSSGLFGGWVSAARRAGSSSGGHAASSKGGSGQQEPGVGPIPFQRWELPRGLQGACNDAVCLGSAPRDLYSVLQGAAKSAAEQQQLIFCVGERQTEGASAAAAAGPPFSCLQYHFCLT